jgi:hypothetical protein
VIAISHAAKPLNLSGGIKAAATALYVSMSIIGPE